MNNEIVYSKPKRKPIDPPPLNPREIGQRIRRVRLDEKRWRLEDLSRIAGIPYPTLYAYETGYRLPVHRNLVRLSIVLNRSIDFLLMGKNSKASIAGRSGGV